MPPPVPIRRYACSRSIPVPEYLSAALLDMGWHELPDGSAPKDVDAFETQVLHQFAIQLDGHHPAGPLQQFLGQRATPRSNFDAQLFALRTRRRRDALQN